MASSNQNDGPKSCVPCASLDRSAVLPLEKVHRRIETVLPLWEVVRTVSDDGEDGPKRITRSFVARNFQAALDVLNAVGVVAEREGHHPDLHLTDYRCVTIDLWTHKVGGITENDLALAKLLDEEVTIDYSPKWLKEHPAAAAKATPNRG